MYKINFFYKTTLVLLLLLLTNYTYLLNAQATVGSDVGCAEGALLDIKTNMPDGNNLTSGRGGIVFPRVWLQALNTLEPFVAENDPDLDILKVQHIGLMVFNMSDENSFIPAFYVWNGQRWARSGENVAPLYSAQNGLRAVGDRAELGGKLLYSTKIDLNGNDLAFVNGLLSINGSDIAVAQNGNTAIGSADVPANKKVYVNGNAKINGNFTVIGTDSINHNAFINGTFRYNYNNGNHSGKVLQAQDSKGTAAWVAAPNIENTTITHSQIGGSSNQDYASDYTNVYSTAHYIELPPGKYLIKFTYLIAPTSTNGAHQKCWVKLGFARRKVYGAGGSPANYENYAKYRDAENEAYPVFVEAAVDNHFGYTQITGNVVIDNFAVSGGDNHEGGTYGTGAGAGFGSNNVSRFDLIIIKDDDRLRPNQHSSWNWPSGGYIRLKGNASENSLVAIKLN